MNLTLKKFQIFRAGTHKSSNGTHHTFTESQLKTLETEYNKIPVNQQAPLFIGHGEKRGGVRNLPMGLNPMGLVSSLEFSSGNLYATAFVTDELLGLVRKGVYKHVSAGFEKTPDKLMLNHVAFLNNPAVKGMEALNFTEAPAPYITFEMDIDFSEVKLPAFASEAHKLDYLAREYQKQHPDTSYQQAAKACLHLTNYR